jgi:hypothetical protein
MINDNNGIFLVHGQLRQVHVSEWEITDDMTRAIQLAIYVVVVQGVFPMRRYTD